MKKIIILLASISIMIAICPDCYSQSMYNSLIEEGIARYNNGKYDDAIKIFKAAAADVKATQAEKDKAKKWISKCNSTKAKVAEDQRKAQIALLEKFIVSAECLNLSAASADTSVVIDAGSPWALESYPSEWCEVQDEINGLSVKLSENRSLSPRNGVIVLKSTITSQKKTYNITHEIPVTQSGRERSMASLCLQTTPGNSVVLVGKEEKIYRSGEVITLQEGETPISVRKTDFMQFDTTIVVNPYEKNKNRYLNVKLIPEFAIIQLSIVPEEGTTLSTYNNPILKIDGHLIDMDEFLSDSSIRTFDSDKPVEMYKLYRGNLLALPGGKNHFISMSAVDFEPFNDEFLVSVGETKPYTIDLVAKSGTLTVNAEGVSVGTKVIVDNKIQGEAPGTFRVAKGAHTVTFQKDGYMSKESAYLIETEEGQDLQIDLEMMQCALYSIYSDPAKATIIFDGVEKWHTPIEDVRISCGYHTLKLVKDGYTTFNEKVYFRPEGDSLQISMQKAYPLEVRSDKENLHIVFIDRKTKSVIKTDSLTNSTVQIPYGKYIMELRRYNVYEQGKEATRQLEKQIGSKDLAYKGRVNFTEKKKSIYRLTFRDKFSFIKGNYYFTGTKLNASASPEVGYRYLADVGLLNVAFIPGYTTSIARVSFFQSVNPGNSSYNPLYLSASCILLNGEFRIGGEIFDCLDVNANISYSFTPKLNSFFEKQTWDIPYISGTDMFLGAEISSRIKAFNLNVKVGEQLFINGEMNTPGKDHVYDVLSFGGVQSAFVVSLGFTLGTTRGNRMIRLF